MGETVFENFDVTCKNCGSKNVVAFGNFDMAAYFYCEDCDADEITS